MFGGFGSPEGMAEAAVAAGAMSEVEASGGFNEYSMDTAGWPGQGGGGAANLMGNYGAPIDFHGQFAGLASHPMTSGYAGSGVRGFTAPTMSFTADQPLGQQITQQQSFVDGLKAFMGLSPTRMGMGFLARMGDLTPTMSFMASDPRADAPITTAGIPGYLGQNYGAGTITDVAMAGSGAHMAPATAIENWGGQNVHVGPGYPMDENFYPGYGTNPFSGVAMADPSDPYIRRRRGTEIAGMI